MLANVFNHSTRLRLIPLAVGVATLALTASAARAGNLADIFNSGELAGLEMGPIGPALANTVASTYPVASASSSVTYAFNPKTETFERQTRVLGPIIGERAETIGKGQIDIGTSISFVDFSTINGDNLGDLVNQPSINGRVVSFPVPGGVTLKDGRFTNFLPVLVHANIDVQATIGTPSITYGVTPDLDVNLSLPLIETYLNVKVNETVPDPRLPQFMLRDCTKRSAATRTRASPARSGRRRSTVRPRTVPSGSAICCCASSTSSCATSPSTSRPASASASRAATPTISGHRHLPGAARAGGVEGHRRALRAVAQPGRQHQRRRRQPQQLPLGGRRHRDRVRSDHGGGGVPRDATSSTRRPIRSARRSSSRSTATTTTTSRSACAACSRRPASSRPTSSCRSTATACAPTTSRRSQAEYAFNGPWNK